MTKGSGNNHLKIGELPVLRMVAIDDLQFHEDPDEERLLGLVNRLGAESILKNPPIVAETDHDGRYIILDGANRVTALIKLKFRHIPVQVVHLDDPSLALRCWHHVIEKLGKDFFLSNLNKIGDLSLKKDKGEENEAARDADHPGHDGFLCRFTFIDSEKISAYHDGDLLSRVERLNAIADLYLHTQYSDRVSYTNPEHLKINYPDFQTLLTYRSFEKRELLKIVSSGRKLPAGITRVLVPKRALGLNIRLEFLKSDLTLEEKNHWLTELIHKMVMNKSIRFYQEPTFSFDE